MTDYRLHSPDRRLVASALVLSLVLHAPLVWWLEHTILSQTAPTPRASIEHVVTLTLAAPVLPEAAPTLVEIEPVVSDAIDPTLDSSTDATAREPVPVLEPLQPVLPDLPETAMLVREIVTGSTGTDFDAYQGCPSIARSKLISCRDTQLASDPVTLRYAELFADGFGGNQVQLEADLQRVETLGEQVAQLEARLPADSTQAALMREQVAAIQDEIMRIDRKHAEVNLLRVVSMGVKAARGLRQQISDAGG